MNGCRIVGHSNIVEGEMDVLALNQVGITNVVSVPDGALLFVAALQWILINPCPLK